MDASVPRGLRPRHTNMKDVAKRAGVSPMTVSHVLHHPETVSEKTRRLLSPGVGTTVALRSARRLRRRG